MKRSDFLRIAGVGALSSSALKIPIQKERKLVKPQRLRPGDTIGFAAPAGIVFDEAEFERMKDVLESFGLRVRFGESVRKRFGYLAGTDVQRADDLMQFFLDPEIKGIVAARGGWGCARILEYLDFEMIQNHPKVYCGFSDNTTLHLAFQALSRLVSFHGPNGTSEWTDLTQKSFKHVIMDGEEVTYQSSGNIQTITKGIAEGQLVGGNLSIFVTSLGTPYQPQVKNGLLFVEDIGEASYKIDRMMTHLKQAGILEDINGFIFGQCTDCMDSLSENDFTIKQVLDHHIKPLGIPAVMGLNIGHNPGNFTLPLGINARMDASSGIVQLTETAVSF